MTITLNDIPANIRSGYTEPDGLEVPRPVGFWLVPASLEQGSQYFPIYGKKPRPAQIALALANQGYVWAENV